MVGSLPQAALHPVGQSDGSAAGFRYANPAAGVIVTKSARHRFANPTAWTAIDAVEVVARRFVVAVGHGGGGRNADDRDRVAGTVEPHERVPVIMPVQHQFRACLRERAAKRSRVDESFVRACPPVPKRASCQLDR